MEVQGYQFVKLLHILGAILFIGNIVATGVWKIFADKTRSPVVIAFGQRMVKITDLALTGGGVSLVLLTGFHMIGTSGLNITEANWLVWALALFVASGLIWVLVLIPIQKKQTSLAQNLNSDSEIPEAYWQLGRSWIFWGGIATLLPIINLYLMVFKPE